MHLVVIIFNDQRDVQFFLAYVSFNYLHVSSIQVLIIRRFNCIITISSICHSDRLVCRFGRSVQTCIPDDHLHRVTYTRYRIDTIESPDDEHLNARNMQRIEINICKKELYVSLVIKQNYYEMYLIKKGNFSALFLNSPSGSETNDKTLVWIVDRQTDRRSTCLNMDTISL